MDLKHLVTNCSTSFIAAGLVYTGHLLTNAAKHEANVKESVHTGRRKLHGELEFSRFFFYIIDIIVSMICASGHVYRCRCTNSHNKLP